MKAMRLATVTVNVIDHRTDAVVFKDLQVAFRIVLDTKLSPERMKSKILLLLPQNLEETLAQLPKGNRVLSNRKNYTVEIGTIESTNLH